MELITVSIISLFIGFVIAFVLQHKLSKVGLKQKGVGLGEKEHGFPENEGFVRIQDEDGFSVIVKEIPQIPTRAIRIESSNSVISRTKQLTSDLVNRGMNLPNKTVSLVFDKDVEKGLARGAYKLTKAQKGGVYPDARNSSSGKIVGKGRLVQGSKARQIASGTFQLLSVVVAQSHLSDIETSLNVIRGSIDELNVRQENEDIAKISGALSYLCEFSNFMKELKCPEEISPQKKNTIEGIIKDAYVYRDKLEEDMSSLIKSIERLADIDNVGTGHTYKRLLELIEKIKPLLERRSIFLNLATAMNFTTAYIDPAKIEFSRIKPGNEAWCEKIELFRETITEKKKIIAKALLNSSETLELRKSKIDSSANDYHRKAAEQEKQYIDLEKSLEDNLARLIDPEGNISLAITLNEHNEVVETAIL